MDKHDLQLFHLFSSSDLNRVYKNENAFGLIQPDGRKGSRPFMQTRAKPSHPRVPTRARSTAASTAAEEHLPSVLLPAQSLEDKSSWTRRS